MMKIQQRGLLLPINVRMEFLVTLTPELVIAVESGPRQNQCVEQVNVLNIYSPITGTLSTPCVSNGSLCH